MPGLAVMIRALLALLLAVVQAIPVSAGAAEPRVHVCASATGASISWSDLTGEAPAPKSGAPLHCAVCLTSAAPFIAASPPASRLRPPLFDGPVAFVAPGAKAPLLLAIADFAARAPPAA